jgi:5'-nucleotidase
MINPRRKFLGQLTFMAGVLSVNKPFTAAAKISKQINTIHSGANAITLYHTTDLNGTINAAHKNVGGLNHIITTINNQQVNGLMLDAGGFLKPGSGVASQKEMLSKMNVAGYHVAGIGQNELTLGQDNLATLIPLMQFSLVNCNYQFNAQLSKLIKPYVIIYSGKFKIGITGVGRQLNGIPYYDAVECANKAAHILKKDEQCDYVICLAHLNSGTNADKLNNLSFANQTTDIDMIIGGNSSKISRNISVTHNKEKSEVLLSETAMNGLLMGRTTINFDSNKQKNGLLANHFIPGLANHTTFAATLPVLRSELKDRLSA